MNTQEVLQALREGALLVTVNNRLARHWRGQFTQAVAAENALWNAPQILPWGAWLRRLWDEASWLDADAPLLLDASQAALVWQKIIERDDAPLLQARATARLAQDAWRLAQDWRISMPFAAHVDAQVDALECNEDVLHFQRWAETFAAECAKRGWLDEARLPAVLLDALAAGCVVLPARVLLLGFENWTPAQRALLDGMRLRGVEVLLVEDEARQAAQPLRIGFADAAQEDAAAARWARAYLEREPTARLAMIAPDLQDRRARLTRLLDAQLAPHCLLPGGRDAPRPWNMSLGAALREHGMVQASLLVFALGETRLELAALGQALRSPFLAGFGEEREARAMLDARLREWGELSLSSTQVRKQALEHGCPQFARILMQLEQARKAQPAMQSPAEWLAALHEALKIAGWPGDAALSSVDFQLRKAWLDALQSLTALGVVQPKMSRGDMLAHARALAAETVFQPEAAADAPVQVLGPLEALGLPFDAVWLLGMQHEQWPPQARPNPFLPMRLQTRLDMPHASPARELAYVRRISARLLSLAQGGEVIVSYPTQAEGRELEPSPLLEHLPESSPAALAQADVPMPAYWTTATARMEWLEDVTAPPVEAGAAIKGGARVLELQSACPFRAFAELRLSATALDEPDLGPDALARGSLLHKVMELLWGELGDQAALLALDEAALRACVQRHVQAAVEAEALKHRSLWPLRLQTLEVARLTELALEWLEVERQRPPFAVEARELQQAIAIGGLQLSVKIDRIDRVGGEDGSKLVIDYKTGKAAPAQWAGERPEAPQLPLYAVSSEQVSALAFAQVRAGEMALSGLADAAAGDIGLKAAEQDWGEVLSDYRRVQEALAAGFRKGDAAVDPRKPAVCGTCSLTMLCRVHEQAGEGFALEEAEG